jgi:hypothetical protein
MAHNYLVTAQPATAVRVCQTVRNFNLKYKYKKLKIYQNYYHLVVASGSL